MPDTLHAGFSLSTQHASSQHAVYSVKDMPLVRTLPVTSMPGSIACCVFGVTCSKGTLILLLETYWLAEHQHLEIMLTVL